MKLWFAVVSLALLACPPSPVNPGPDADASLDGTPEAACAALAAIPCPEADSPSECVKTISKVVHDGLQRVPLGCMSRAATADEMRRCGFVRCAR